MNPKNKLEPDAPISDLTEDLGSADFLTRQRARLLLVHREPGSIPALIKVLSSPNVHTRWEAVQALGEIRDPQTGPDLAEMLVDQDTGVRWAAMESLIHLGRDCLRPILDKFIKDFDSIWLREGVRHILRVLKDRHELNELEITLFDYLDQQSIPGFEPGWNSHQTWAAEKALEQLDQEAIQAR